MAGFDRVRQQRIAMALRARLVSTWRAALVVLVGLAGVASITGLKSDHISDSAAQQPRPRRFSHGDHRSEPCAACHDSRTRHGQLRFTGVAGCQSCHHDGPAREQCATCHKAVRTGPARPVAFALTVTNRVVSRPVRFAHSAHTSIQCARCHAAAPERAPSNAECAGCHGDHHGAAVTCSGCHQGSAAIAADHKMADHATCATSSCHGARGADLPNTRAMCLTCHAPQQTHRPGRLCNECHRVRPS